MATNFELKARCEDLSKAEATARELGAADMGWLHQIDTYFNVTSGRLKLREINDDRAELIQYHRDDRTDIRRSSYSVIPLSADQAVKLRGALAAALGIRVRVVKRRHLLIWNQVRIHLDAVEQLGSFMEFEALVGPSCDEAQAAEKAATLTRAFAIAAADRISTSYSDLLLNR